MGLQGPEKPREYCPRSLPRAALPAWAARSALQPPVPPPGVHLGVSVTELAALGDGATGDATPSSPGQRPSTPMTPSPAASPDLWQKPLNSSLCPNSSHPPSPSPQGRQPGPSLTPQVSLPSASSPGCRGPRGLRGPARASPPPSLLLLTFGDPQPSRPVSSRRHEASGPLQRRPRCSQRARGPGLARGRAGRNLTPCVGCSHASPGPSSSNHPQGHRCARALRPGPA